MTQDRADLGLPSRSHDADRYAFSPKVRRLKELLAKIEPAPARVERPYQAPKRSERPSFALA
jgi:hypothetical protein